MTHLVHPQENLYYKNNITRRIIGRLFNSNSKNGHQPCFLGSNVTISRVMTVLFIFKPHLLTHA